MSPLPSSPSLEVQAALALLHECSELGVLRRLDAAFAGFIYELDPSAPAATLVAAALVSQCEGRGHTCLSLADFLHDPLTSLAWESTHAGTAARLRALLPSSPEEWKAAILASGTVRDGLSQPDAGQPLVLLQSKSGDLLYFRRYWGYETTVAAEITQRCTSVISPQAELQLAAVLARLFPTLSAAPQAIDWQKLACATALRGNLTVITGGPGTGKTYTAARVLAALFASTDPEISLRIALAAPTGKAAARLKQSIQSSMLSLQSVLPSDDEQAPLDLARFIDRIGPARTLHSLLGARPNTRALKYHRGAPLDLDVLIIDEASMIHIEMMAGLLQAVPAHCRLIFLGDKDQLASVEAGAVMGDLCAGAEQGQYSAAFISYASRVAEIALPADYACPKNPAALPQHTVMLRKSQRFAGAIGQLAQAVNAGKIETACATLANDTAGSVQAYEAVTANTAVDLALRGRKGAEGGYACYLKRIADGPSSKQPDDYQKWVAEVLQDFDKFRILCAIRKGDWGAEGQNQAIQQALNAAGLIRQTGEWYVGRPVLITKNDSAQGVFNGDIGITLPAMHGAGLRVWLQTGDQLRSVSVNRLPHVETAYAMTVHKSQGSEFAHTVLVLPAQQSAVLSRELVYTGITRARTAFTLVAANHEAFRHAIAQPTKRVSGLQIFLTQGEQAPLNSCAPS